MRKTVIIASCIILVCFWLYATEYGLKTIVASINFFNKEKMLIEAATGGLNKEIQLHQITYKDKLVSVRIKTLFLKPESIKKIITGNNLLTMHAEDITIEPNVEIFATTNTNNGQNIIAKLDGIVNYSDKNLTINIENFSGTWQGYPLTGIANIQKRSGVFAIDTAEIRIAENSLQLITSTPTEKKWQLHLPSTEKIFPSMSGSLTAGGTLNHSLSPIISGQVNMKNFQIMQIQLQNCTANFEIPFDKNMPLHITSKIKQLKYNNLHMDDLTINAIGTNNKQDITLNFTNQKQIFNLQLDSEVLANTWHGKIKDLKLNSPTLGNWKIQQPCALVIDDKHVNLTSCTLAADNMDSKLTLAGNIDHQAKHINAEITGNSNNIYWLMRWFPAVTRLKGVLSTNTTINGDLANPLITTDTVVKNITMTLPAYGIKIKPLELRLSGNSKNKILLSGNGKIRKGSGSFTISGFIDPSKPDLPHAINIIGKEVEFINTPSYHLIANSNLTLTFKSLKAMVIAGKLQILHGIIDLDKRTPIETHRTKDIKLINQKNVPVQDDFEIIPDLFVRIEDEVKLKGLGLSAVISGKLKITKSEQLLRGDGRISTKKGSYKITGQKLYVHYGKLYYPPGTLLTNPYLDIKISKTKPIKEEKKEKSDTFDDNKACLYVQGTWNNPIMQDNGLIKNDQALSQMLNFGSGSLITKLQDKFKLSELNIASSEVNYDPMAQQSKNDAFLDNKNLIIGKKLNKKVYLQYSKGLMNSTQNTIRLKYLLNKNWAIAVETGTVGNGADLSFSIDKD